MFGTLKLRHRMVGCSEAVHQNTCFIVFCFVEQRCGQQKQDKEGGAVDTSWSRTVFGRGVRCKGNATRTTSDLEVNSYRPITHVTL